MLPITRPLLIPTLLILLTTTLAAETVELVGPADEGRVQIPLELYNQLLASAQTTPTIDPAPASYALGSAEVQVTVRRGGTDGAGLFQGEAQVTLRLRVLEDTWTAVPVLPAGTAVETANVDGNTIELLPSPVGLVWIARGAGSHTMTLTYRIDAASEGDGASLAVPLPAAASIRLAAALPGTGLDVAVIPAAGVRQEEEGGATRVNATIPTSSGVQIAWRLPGGGGHSLSRATYRGELRGGAVLWEGEIEVELWEDSAVVLPLLPRSSTLSALRLDGRDAPILVESGRFATRVTGRGRHSLGVSFETPVQHGDGPPRVELEVPPVPVSRFELVLPGKKEVHAEPGSTVATTRRNDSTVASVHIPLSSRVAFSWTEAVPEEVRAEARSNAAIYHAARAEEGVLLMRALVEWEVTRGTTNVLRLAVPPEVQINRVATAAGGADAVADWRVTAQDETSDAPQLEIFLDRQLEGQLVLEVDYDRSLPPRASAPEATSPEIVLPLLAAREVRRQRGMTALLSSSELTLRPSSEEGATRVGENQLPAFVRDALEHPVAHTFKYVEPPSDLRVAAVEPERRVGRFDAAVDTLISLGEVSLKGNATLELDVKAGSLTELHLEMPADVNLLSLSGPSIRQHEILEPDDQDPTDTPRTVEIRFTQDIEGQLLLELTYERLLGDGTGELAVPVVRVEGAEVEQGRLAIEALAAVEVRPATVEQLTVLDIGELPRRLVLRTTNPILMAYKYVRAESGVRLGLEVTRHELLTVEQAAIDEARYRTLLTRDGLAMTTARFQVRNSGEQFLRIALPETAEVLSVFVAGRAEKPAQTSIENGRKTILVKMLHSTEGFPVELVYRQTSTPIGGWWGSAVRAELPQPDILVTTTHWEVDLPDGVRYLEPRTNLDIEAADIPASPPASQTENMPEETPRANQATDPLRLRVPESGRRFVLTKLYANQADHATAWVEIPYVSAVGERVGRGASVLGAALTWLGLLAAWRIAPWRRAGSVAAVLGAGLVAGIGQRYHVGLEAAVWTSVVAALGLVIWWGRSWWTRRLATPE